MRWWWGFGVVVMGLGGCRASAPTAPRADWPAMPPAVSELPHTTPTLPVLDGKGLSPITFAAAPQVDGLTFRRLNDIDCLRLAAAHAAGAGLFDEENRVPASPARRNPRGCDAPRDSLRQALRYHTALELRNRSAADALERFFQLTEVVAGADIVRTGFSIIDPLLAKARDARARSIRYPLDPDDLERQRSQLRAQLEQLELASRLLNLDLKRRLGLPYQPASERLWPSGDFAIDPTPTDPEQAATAAIADRPELRGLRTLHAGLTPETLPDARDLLGALVPLAGGQRVPAGITLALAIQRITHRDGPDAATLAELGVRRRQLAELIATRERAVADEARAAALTLNSQRVRAALARDRLRGWEDKLADAIRRREADQPNAELLEAQVRMEWLKVRADLITEVAAWHRSRVKLRAAMGWLAWEAMGTPSGLTP